MIFDTSSEEGELSFSLAMAEVAQVKILQPQANLKHLKLSPGQAQTSQR